MAITKQITQPPEAPQRSDPDTFANRADAFVAWLETFRDDLTEWTGQLNSTQNQINALQNIRVYSDSDTYNFPDLVVASDGYVYRCLGNDVQGDNPVSSNTGNWVRITNAYIDNLSATVNPSVNDDITKGYGIGSKWINLSTGRVFICLDATEGNAKWKCVTEPQRYYRGLSVKRTPSMDRLSVSVTSKQVVVSGFSFEDVSLTCSFDITYADQPNGYDYANYGNPADGDIWYLFLITDDVGSNVAGWFSKNSGESSVSLPDGYTTAMLISFVRFASDDSGVYILAFSQKGKDYSYWNYQVLFTNVTLPAGYSNAVSYDVSGYAPLAICEQVEIDIIAYGTSTTTADAVAMGQDGEEWIQSDGFHDEGFENDFVRARTWFPIDSSNSTIEFWSANGNNSCSAYVKGAKLSI